MIKQKPLQIFSKDADMGIDVVKSPVKLTILEMLRSNDMEFDEIVKNTGKSKSTISVHLKSLREDGIISYRLGESDSRRKIFYLNSKQMLYPFPQYSQPKSIEPHMDYSFGTFPLLLPVEPLH